MNVEKKRSEKYEGSTRVTIMSIINVDLADQCHIKKKPTKEPVKYDRN